MPELTCKGCKVENDMPGRMAEGMAFPRIKCQKVGACVYMYETSNSSLPAKHDIQDRECHRRQGPPSGWPCLPMMLEMGLDSPGLLIATSMLMPNHQAQT